MSLVDLHKLQSIKIVCLCVCVFSTPTLNRVTRRGHFSFLLLSGFYFNSLSLLFEQVSVNAVGEEGSGKLDPRHPVRRGVVIMNTSGMGIGAVHLSTSFGGVKNLSMT